MKSKITTAVAICATLLGGANAADKNGNEDAIEGGTATKSNTTKPTYENVKYGEHKLQVLDFWQARSDKPTPLVIFIHGGGFRGGDKRGFLRVEYLKGCLDAGISYAAINYRLTPEVTYPAPMQDGARAVQFLRSKAKEWNLDPTRFGATGGSAGAGISLWLAFHDDLADPKSDDPIARESTRLSCVAVYNAQCSYDPRFIKEHIPGNASRHDAMAKFFGLKQEDYKEFPADKIKLFEESASINHVTKDDPPVYMWYEFENGPVTNKSPAGHAIHHPKFGELLKAKLDELKIENHLLWKGDGKKVENVKFLIDHLKAEKK